MIRTHFLVAFRHLMKSKMFTMINVTGLTVGFTAFFLILQYLNFELSFDRFHENHDRIYRVAYQQIENNEVIKSSASTFYGVGDFLRQHFDEIDHVVRFYRWPANTGAVLMAEGKVFNERNYFFTELAFFKVFPSLLVQGDANTCLQQPNSIVISKRLARKMFGTEDVMGKEIKRLDLENSWLRITGVMRDIPANSHFDLDVLIPYDKDWIPDKEGTWNFPNNTTYLLFKEKENATAIESRLNKLLAKEQRNNPALKNARTILQPMDDIHFSSFQDGEMKGNASERVLIGIGVAAIIILLIAWINYINLEISRFLTRIREVGVRRVIGSSRTQLITQFFIQFVCLAFISLIFTVLLIMSVKPFYHHLTGSDFLPFSESILWPSVIALLIFLLGSIVAGLYPAFFLSRLNPIACIKGVVSTSSSTLKKGLLTFQLVASIILLSFLFIVWQQLGFMRSAEQTMELNRVLTVYNTTSYSIHDDSLKKERSITFRNKLLQNPAFRDVSCSSVIPGEPVGFTYHNLTKRALTDPDDNVPYKVVFVDYHYIPVYQLPLKAGRNYSVDSGEDNNSNSIILNESAIKTLGFKSAEEAINHDVYFMVTFDWKKYKIIGVVEDYRHESVKVPVYPTVFFLHRYVGQMTYYSIQMDERANAAQGLSFAEKVWKEVWPEKPFDYAFADQLYDRQFKSEKSLSQIFFTFGLIAVFLACLGVMGMTLFEATSRLREISIRKILGATLGTLITLLTRDLVKVLFIAIVVALPLSYVIATQWLNTYPAKIDLTLWSFMLPLIGVFGVVFFVAVINTWRAAETNPIDHLKNE